jgi:uncharacterized glyoxalase superfamily protein PhnB
MSEFTSKYILFWSPDPDKLAKFYMDVLELELIDKTDIPAKDGLEKDYGYDLKLSDTNILWIGHHDGIGKKNKDSLRHMINLDLHHGDFDKWVHRIREAGCEIIQEPILTPFSTKESPTHVFTWLDPEDNCWQFFGIPKESD